MAGGVCVQTSQTQSCGPQRHVSPGQHGATGTGLPATATDDTNEEEEEEEEEVEVEDEERLSPQSWLRTRHTGLPASPRVALNSLVWWGVPGPGVHNA